MGEGKGASCWCSNLKLAISLGPSQFRLRCDVFTDAEPARGAFLLAERDMFTTRRALAIRRAMKVESQDKACKERKQNSRRAPVATGTWIIRTGQPGGN